AQGIGVWAVLFPAFLTLLAWLLKNEYWRDVHYVHRWAGGVRSGRTRAAPSPDAGMPDRVTCREGRPAPCDRRIPVAGEGLDGCESTYAQRNDPVFGRRRRALPPGEAGAGRQGRGL